MRIQIVPPRPPRDASTRLAFRATGSIPNRPRRVSPRIHIERRSDDCNRRFRPSDVEDTAPEGSGRSTRGTSMPSSSTGSDAVAFVAKSDAGSMPASSYRQREQGSSDCVELPDSSPLGRPGTEFAREFFRRADPGVPRAVGLVPEGVRSPPAFLVVRGGDFRRILAEYEHDWLRHRVGLVRPDG